MAKPVEHPEGELESERLKDVIRFIKGRLNGLNSASPMYGLAGELNAQHRNQVRLRDSLIELLDKEPYFGRFDFREYGKVEVEELYITKFQSHCSALYSWKGSVVSWASPIGGMYYEQSRKSVQSKIPDGEIRGEVLLRRALSIQKRRLERIDDLFDVRKVDRVADKSRIPVTPHYKDREPSERFISDPDEFLRLVLEGKQGKGLTEVVTSIQERQNALMRADPEQILIVQGAAGSGKTTIALHRIAILLYVPDGRRESNTRRILGIGPNKLFLRFVSQVLPDLDISGVQQRTFIDWASSVTGIEALSEVLDLTLHKVYDPREMALEAAREAYRSSREKGKLEFLSRLQKQVEGKRVRARAMTCSPVGVDAFQGANCSITEKDMEILVESTTHMPVNRQRDKVVEGIAQHLLEQYEIESEARADWMAETLLSSFGMPDSIAQLWEEQLRAYGYDRSNAKGQMTPSMSTSLKKRRECTLQHIKEEIRKIVENEFQRLSPVEVYVDFLDNVDRKYLLRVEDVAPVTFLYMLLEGYQPNQDHIIVDEAQDMSPAEMWLLRKSVTSGSMTILGDLPQSIHSYRGISSWDELNEVFPEDRVSLETIEVSYRSTFEIMTFANKVLRTRALNKWGFSLATPFKRHGERIRAIGVKNEKTHRDNIMQEIRRLKALGLNTIALVCSDIVESQEIHEFLDDRDNSVELISSENSEYTKQLVVIPAFLAKGIEFDACIIVDASQSKYPSDVRYGRLLYVAITRALHELVVLWIGTPSTHIPEEYSINAP